MERPLTEATESRQVPLWLWRTTVGALALIALVGLTTALWLGTRPVVMGAPVPAQELGGWTFGPGASGDEDGGRLTLRTSETDRPAYATSALAPSDFTVQVRAMWLAGPDDAGYGLVMRYQRPDDFIAFLIGPDGYIAVGQMASGEWRWRVRWQQWPHIKRGSHENLLRAECRADRCRFYVNDEFAFQVNGVSAQGQLGPAVWSPAQGETVSAVFREWQVWK
jgi:hypothetical protein